MSFPFRAAPLEIGRHACRGLVTVFGVLGEQLDDDSGNTERDRADTFVWWRRLTRYMTVDQFHRVGCREWKKSREHLIQGDTKRVEIAAGIDRSIHPAGLLGCHIGEGAADGFGRIGSLALARKMRCDAKARQPDFARR